MANMFSRMQPSEIQPCAFRILQALKAPMAAAGFEIVSAEQGLTLHSVAGWRAGMR